MNAKRGSNIVLLFLIGLGISIPCGCQPKQEKASRTNAPQSPSAERRGAIDAAAARFVSLSLDRLRLMHDVARWKWNHEKPIADPDRERRLLDDVADQGTRSGLPTEFATRAFQGQFEVAKRIQEADFAQWKGANEGEFEDVPDLATVTRPRIDALSSEILRTLAELYPDLPQETTIESLRKHAAQALAEEGIDESIRNVLLESMVPESSDSY